MAGGRLRGHSTFRYAVKIGLRQDEVWAADPIAGTVQVFDSIGRRIHEFEGLSFQDPAGAVGEGPWAMLSDGTFILTPSYLPAFLPVGVAANGYFIRVDRAGRVLDTLFATSFRRRTLGSGSDTVAVSELSRNPLIAVDPTGRFVVTTVRVDSGASEGYIGLVVRRDIEENTIKRWRFSAPSVRNPESAVRRLARADSFTLASHYPGAEVSVDSLVIQRGFPKYREPVADLLVTSDGNVWLEVIDPLGRAWWEALDNAGNACAKFLSPPNVRITEIDNWLAWGVERRASPPADEIRRYRLVVGSAVLPQASFCANP